MVVVAPTAFLPCAIHGHGRSGLPALAIGTIRDNISRVKPSGRRATVNECHARLSAATTRSTYGPCVRPLAYNARTDSVIYGGDPTLCLQHTGETRHLETMASANSA